MTTNPNCPSEERLDALLKGKLSPDAQESLARHLEQCPACQQALEALAGDGDWVKQGSSAPSPDTEALRRVVEDLKARGPAADPPQSGPPTVDFLTPSYKPGYLGRFGPYDIVEVVAAGGMGIVLKGHDPALNRIVAIKVLAPVLAANATARQRFLREARAAAAVTHDHVVTIHAVDEANNLPYLVMQFVAGRSLDERIKATAPLAIEEILRIGRQIALGLAAAHAQGLIHRDIKPGNILLENGIERVKITDFGLARAVDDAAVTQSGCITGTPEFMAPEQARGEWLDPRADLFSLGCVLYAMGTGRSPFHGGSVLAVLRNVCDTEPRPLHEVNPGLPRWFGDIVTRLMAKAPAERFQSAAEVATLLERYLARVQHRDWKGAAGSSTVKIPTPARAPRRRTRVWQAAAVLVAVATVGLFVAEQVGLISLGPWSRDPPNITNAPPISVLPKNAIVLLAKSGDGAGQSFDDLAKAIAAAAAGDTIELRFNETLPVQRVRIDRALTIRAGDGFEPVLANASESETLILAQAPLVLEGIELRSWAANGGAPPRDPPRREFGPGRAGAPGFPGFSRAAPPPYLILATRTPLLLAHCRLSSGGHMNRNTIEVANADHCVVWHSELYDILGPQGGPAVAFILDHLESARAEPARLTLRNCVHHGGNAVLLSQSPRLPALVEVSHNTFGGRSVLRLVGPGAGANLVVQASSNHFASLQLFQAGGRPLIERPNGMQWRDQHNLFSAGLFSRRDGFAPQGQGPVKTLADWERLWGQTNTDSRVLPSEFARHLAQKSESGEKLTPRDFGLSPPEESNAPVMPPRFFADQGATVERVGPGAAYGRWRNSEEYGAWTALVRQLTADKPQKAAAAR